MSDNEITDTQNTPAESSMKQDFGVSKVLKALRRPPILDEKKEKERLNEEAISEPYVPKDGLPVLFKYEDMDLYINKITLEAYIFHGKKIDYNFEKLIYDPEDYSVIVVYQDGTRKDLGVRINYQVRPYWEQLADIGIVRTVKGESVDGVMVPIEIKGLEITGLPTELQE